MFNKVIESGIAREVLVDDPELYFYYAQLLSYRNDQTYLCCPSYDTLAKDCHISHSTVHKYNERLHDLGLLYWAKFKDR